MAYMKALVSHPSGELKLGDVPVPELDKNRYARYDLLCEVEYCSICGSDIHKWRADTSGVQTTPRSVMVGHEIVTMCCGRCPACREGRFNICNIRPPMEGRANRSISCARAGGCFGPAEESGEELLRPSTPTRWS